MQIIELVTEAETLIHFVIFFRLFELQTTKSAFKQDKNDLYELLKYHFSLMKVIRLCLLYIFK